jgi:hypothetical protein
MIKNVETSYFTHENNSHQSSNSQTPDIFATPDSTKKPGLSGLIPDVW